MKQLKKGEKQKQLWNSIIYIKLSSCCTKKWKICMAKEMYT